MADAPPAYNPDMAQEEVPTSPLLANETQQFVQPVVVQPQPQQIIYTQGQQPQQQDNYNDGNMYVAPSQQQPVYAQPTYQQQGQVVVQPQQQLQPQQIAAAPQGQYQPTQQQLGEGLPQLPIIVTAPEQPTIVGPPKDGVGCQEGCARNPHLLTWIFTISLWFMIFSGLVCNVAFSSEDSGFCGSFFNQMGPFLGVLAAVLIIYLIECGCSGTGKYLNNILQKEGASQFVERVKGQPAVIWWRVACYHWETRYRTKTVRDSNGNTRTERESYREKVYTWRAREQYQYGTCIDVSGDLVGLDEWKLCKLKLHKTYGFADDFTQQHYSQQRRTFRMLNWRDVHQEFHEEFTIPGFIDRILAESEPGVKPGWMTAGMYWLFNLIGFSPCFRTAMASRCGKVKYTFIKQISVARY